MDRGLINKNVYIPASDANAKRQKSVDINY